jgi:hypothetical protein
MIATPPNAPVVAPPLAKGPTAGTVGLVVFRGDAPTPPLAKVPSYEELGLKCVGGSGSVPATSGNGIPGTGLGLKCVGGSGSVAPLLAGGPIYEHLDAVPQAVLDIIQHFGDLMIRWCDRLERKVDALRSANERERPLSETGSVRGSTSAGLAAPQTPGVLPQLLSAADLARCLGQPPDRVETFLRRVRTKCLDCYIEVESPRKGEPRYLYRTKDVWPLLKGHYLSGGK